MKKNLTQHALILASVFFLLLSSCKKKDFLSGYDTDALFASPTQVEIEHVLEDWSKRNLNPTDYNIVQQVALPGNIELKIVSYRISGIKEYGALLIPKTDSTIPVRMYVGGFGIDQPVNSVAVAADSMVFSKPFILAIPALRGQSLDIRVNGTAYTSQLSEGDHCDAFDGGTDDVIGFLNLIAQTENKADVNRTSVRGGSRGGTVALLAGIRDKRVKRVVGVAGPTEFISQTSRNQNDATYQCQFLDDLKNNRSDIAGTRYKMIASSPLFFAQYLPLTQLHMGSKDPIVPVDQGYKLEEKMSNLGMKAGFQLFIYDRAHSDIATNNTELTTRIDEFLSQL